MLPPNILHANLGGIPPQNPNLNLIMRKASNKSQLMDILQNTWPVLLKTAKVIRNKLVNLETIQISFEW